MTVSFQHMFGTNSQPISASSPQCNTAVCQTTPTNEVGVLTDVSQEDSDREERIRHHRTCMEAAMKMYEAHGVIHDKACADYHEIRLNAEIAASGGNIG